jgi:hypothetical protein
MTNDESEGRTVPLGRIRSLMNEYEHRIERGEDEHVYKRVCADLRRAIEPEQQSAS